MIPVILSGGSGTRLWPLSRNHFPKQFVELFGESLQAKTLKRLSPLGESILLTNHQLKVLTERQLLGLQLFPEVIYEPFSKNTAPAMALVTTLLMKRGLGHEILAVCPSDHLIRNEDLFRKTVKQAEVYAKQDFIVTLGISPKSPETGYGYIEALQEGEESAFAVRKFHEKPELTQAREYLKAGNYYWNAGIFLFKAERMWSLLHKYLPEIMDSMNHLKLDLSNLSEIFSRVPSVSIDYGLMEKLGADELRVLPAAFDWSDVGSWDSVVEQRESLSETIQLDSREVYFVGMKHKVYSSVGVEDLVIVDTEDVLLVAKKGETQRVREVVGRLKELKSSLTEEHVFEFRPWGEFEVLRDTPYFKSKVIQVNPQAQISYQSHKLRAEHWIIIRGEGLVTLNEKTIQAKPGDSIYIPKGEKHRIKNTGDSILEFIEVQLGSYFGEDDIVRFSDDYGRV